ncbi:nucleolar transcription factor 1-A-like isoform X3 [Nilaparvata lugens]|uniref:nucleolar transcription factor 1-A-like isoform X1 n=1 Tax=Nilaparvata lugens TaxID=108931 RepID=UPI00193E2F0F|nr:nucleolar transcription factor 1-A-like isoform X1 [Nilaparvata lugens]XP_039278516.1 nucleolar transcription factor 1-A-like isoform X3 [Nilaparvata lugens]
MNNEHSPTKKAKRPRKDKGEEESPRKKLKGDDPKHHVENHVDKEPVVSDVTWTDEERKKLLSRMEAQLPAADSSMYKTSLAAVNWDSVKFDHYTSEQCRHEFSTILSNIRKFRTLSEIMADAVKWVDAPKKKTAHPDKPSKPMTSYIIFYAEKRAKLAKKYPDMKCTELAQKIADKFKQLPPEKKQKYIDKYERQKEEFQEKLKKFYELHPDQIPVEVHKKKLNPAGLTKPQPPFKLYCDERLKKHEQDENFDQKAFLVKCKAKWQNMSERKKFVWIKYTVEKENEYMAKMRAFQATNPEQCTLNDFKSVLLKEEKNIYDRACGKPVKPPNSAYQLFCSEHLKGCSDGSQKQKMKECSEKWKSMTSLHKSEFNDRLKKLQAEYESAYAEYLKSLPEDKRLAELEAHSSKIKKKVAKTNHKAETMCTALENFIQRSEKKPETSTAEMFANEPAVPPKTATEYFVKKYLSEKHGEPISKQQAKGAWQALSDKKRLKYEKELTLLKAKYIHDYEAFLKGMDKQQLEKFSELTQKRKQQKASSSEDSEDSEDSDDSEEEEEEEEEEGDEEGSKKSEEPPKVDDSTTSDSSSSSD